MRRGGFSILEVLVALAVFAIGVNGLLVALGYNLKDISFASDHARAVRIASRELNALRRLKNPPDQEVEGEEGRFAWSGTVEEIDPDELPGTTADESSSSRALKPYRMTVAVQWSDGPGGERVRKLDMQGVELFQRR